MAAVIGTDDGTVGSAVEGTDSSPKGIGSDGQSSAGVRGISTSGFGVYAKSTNMSAVYAGSTSTKGSASVWCESSGSGPAIMAVAHNPGPAGAYISGLTTGLSVMALASGGIGIHSQGPIAGQFDGPVNINNGTLTIASGLNSGISAKNGNGSGIGIAYGGGIYGDSDNGWGLIGTSGTYDGVRGENNGNGAAVHGVCHSTSGQAGLFDGPVKVNGTLTASSPKGTGLHGQNGNGSGIAIGFAGGVQGDSDNGWGVIGTSGTYDGVRGENNGNGAAIHGVCHSTGGQAGRFDGTLAVYGNATVSGTITVSGDIILPGADCAEEFDMAGNLAPIPGAVMVINDEGALALASEAYDPRVAGVISGAGTFRAALTLDRRVDATNARGAIALIGKAWCQVDTSEAPIRVGDLLTTSATPGHAMRADPDRISPGTILGKALSPFDSARGLIPMLITMQ